MFYDYAWRQIVSEGQFSADLEAVGAMQCSFRPHAISAHIAIFICVSLGVITRTYAAPGATPDVLSLLLIITAKWAYIG